MEASRYHLYALQITSIYPPAKKRSLYPCLVLQLFRLLPRDTSRSPDSDAQRAYIPRYTGA